MQKPISAGTVISHRYQVQKKIHDNTFNSCYLAEDSENSNRLVMLSFPRIELLILPEFTPTFAEVCTELTTRSFHGLLKVLGHGEYNSQPYAVLQYVTDETLEHVLGRKRVSSTKVTLESVLDWATPLSVTLDELHRFGYIHGSLKPSSVYIGSQQILMGDFITEYTLQKMGKFKNGITTLNVDQYLSPEYLKSSYTTHYDQYLLATMVYEALAGKVPFARSKGGDDYRMQVATHVSPLLTAHRPELKAVSDVLAKAMKRKPTDRYKSCRQFVSELQEALAAEPAKPPPQKKVVITTPFSDEPEEEEEIITSIRKNKQSNASGGKKGLAWLSVLFVAGGAAAFTAINYPHVFGLDGKEKVAVDEAAKPVVVPIAVAPIAAPVSKVESAPVVADSSEKEVSPKVVDANVSVADKVIQTAETEKVPAEEVAQLPTESDAPSTETLNELHNVINLALESGQQDFIATQQASANEVAQHEALERAVTEALLKGQDAYMSKAATEALASLSSVEVVSENTAQTETAETQNEPQSVALIANSEQELLDAEASLATDEKPSETTVVLAAPQSPAPTERTAVVEWEQENGEQVQSQSNVAQVVAAPEAAAATPVDRETALQQRREQIQAIKEQKLARIKTITDDCVIGGRIHRETAAGNLPYVKTCLSVGVKPNVTQNNGWTLLHIAARSGHLNLCKLLIAKGAVVNVKAKNGQTPIQMAQSLRQDKVVAYLKTRGGVL